MRVLEVNDAGLRLCDGAQVLATEPGFASVSGDQIIVGERARQLARRSPQLSHSRFWYQLDQTPLERPLSRVRHTNTLVIADRGFPFWPMIETVDLSLTDNIPTVQDVLRALLQNFVIGRISMAEEFLKHNTAETQAQFTALLDGIHIDFEPHVSFKRRVPNAIGLIRTGDTTQYANMILESA